MRQTEYSVEQLLSRQLAQSRPTVTSPVSLYSPGDGAQAVVKRVIICNTSGANAAYDLFHDDDGATYDESTQLVKDNTVTAGVTHVFDDELYVDSSGNIAIATDNTAALTFSLYGDEWRSR